jgi:hypothetical protein
MSETGPNRVAAQARERIADLDATIASALPADRKHLRQRRKLLADIEGWCKTRAGYSEPVK